MSLPPFFLEGWGVYSMRLGREEKLYVGEGEEEGEGEKEVERWLKELYLLEGEMIAAMRVVGDIGRNYMGWKREKVEELFRRWSLGGEREKEVERIELYPTFGVVGGVGSDLIGSEREKWCKRGKGSCDLVGFHEFLMEEGEGVVSFF